MWFSDIIYQICQVTLQDNMIKDCDYMKGSSLYVTFLMGLLAIAILEVEICF